jgi:uncharacterized membrane protein
VKLHLNETKHPKQDFQVERIAFFSDAVFAIAITLLIIEFKVPHLTKDTTAAELWLEVLSMKFKFGAVLVSFALIVNYWIRHHTLFKHIHNYNKEIIMANMVTLVPIIFFPFTTAFFYDSIGVNNNASVIPVRLFLINNILAGVTMFYFYWVVIKKNKLMSFTMNKEDSKEFENILTSMALSFLLVLILSFFSYKYCFGGLIPLACYSLYIKYIAKKNSLNKTNVR